MQLALSMVARSLAELPSLSMLFEVPKKCSLILVINVTLNSFAQNLHFSSQVLPCFVGGITHPTNVHSSALEGGHGIVRLFRNCLLPLIA